MKSPFNIDTALLASALEKEQEPMKSVEAAYTLLKELLGYTHQQAKQILKQD